MPDKKLAYRCETCPNDCIIIRTANPVFHVDFEGICPFNGLTITTVRAIK